MPPKETTKDDVSASATPKSHTKEPLKTSEAYDSDDADIELISSNNFIFKVHSYRLQFTSSMISMATTASQRDPIVLTDPNVEHSLVVKEVLDIIYNHQVDALSVYAWANLYLYVVEFAKKWEMSMITDFIRKELSMDMKDDNHAFRAFDFLLVALNLGDNSLAAQCYEAMRSESWAAYDPRHVDGEVGFASDDQPYAADKSEFEEEDGLPIQYLDDSPAFKLTDNNPLAVTPNSCFGHLGAMPYSWFLRLPPTVAWIIHRANTHYQFGLGSGKDIFKELLDLEYPPPKLSKSSN